MTPVEIFKEIFSFFDIISERKKDIKIEENYSEIRRDFEESLIDLGYSPELVSEIDDGRDEFVLDYKNNL